MTKQTALAGLRYAMKKKNTRREKFFVEMDAVVPAARMLGFIGAYYPKTWPKDARPRTPVEMMVRVDLLHQWYTLSDPMAEVRYGSSGCGNLVSASHAQRAFRKRQPRPTWLQLAG